MDKKLKNRGVVTSILETMVKFFLKALFLSWVFSGNYYWFIKPVFTTLPDIDKIQAVGIAAAIIALFPGPRFTKKQLANMGVSSYQAVMGGYLLVLFLCWALNLLICYIQSI